MNEEIALQILTELRVTNFLNIFIIVGLFAMIFVIMFTKD